MNYLDIAEQTAKNGIEFKRLNAKCKNCTHCAHKEFPEAGTEFYQCRVPFGDGLIYLDKKPNDYCSDFKAVR